MSTATADAPVAAPPKGKKKLIIIIAVAALVLVGGGVGGLMLMKKKAADAEAAEAADGEEGAPAKRAAVKHDPKHVPTFVPLDPFTVNLADREAERYAQLGITLEIEDAKLGDQIKAYMPAIRNHILMAIADRKAEELLAREGKTALAEKIRRETSRVLGYDVPEDEAPAAEDKAGAKKKKKKAAAELPVKAVHFSNFIIQ